MSEEQVVEVVVVGVEIVQCIKENDDKCSQLPRQKIYIHRGGK